MSVARHVVRFVYECCTWRTTWNRGQISINMNTRIQVWCDELVPKLMCARRAHWLHRSWCARDAYINYIETELPKHQPILAHPYYYVLLLLLNMLMSAYHWLFYTSKSPIGALGAATFWPTQLALLLRAAAASCCVLLRAALCKLLRCSAALLRRCCAAC